MFIALLMRPGALAHARVGPPRATPERRAAPARAAARPTAAAPTRARAAAPARPAAATRARAAAPARPAAPPHAHWRWPLHGPVVGRFQIAPRSPYAPGQRRGIDVAAPPGSTVRAACPGRVTFTGALPRLGLAVSVRCGTLVATYLRLAHLAVHRGAIVLPGEPLGALDATGALRLGARRFGDRRGYLDPLTLLHDPPPLPPTLGPAPRPRRARPARPARPHTVRPRPARPWPQRTSAPRPLPRRTAPPAIADPAAGTKRLPWPAYPALALIATALPVGGLVRRRRRAGALRSAARAPV
jgi:murein DD-endopeptidase MepM/ murein hydrolase activator NlpD